MTDDADYVELATQDELGAIKLGGEFGFQIVPPGAGWESRDQWTVQLPHQCDAWEIGGGPTPAAAAEVLERFIAEAESARSRLLEIGDTP